jgi:hypothetical protein
MLGVRSDPRDRAGARAALGLSSSSSSIALLVGASGEGDANVEHAAQRQDLDRPGRRNLSLAVADVVDEERLDYGDRAGVGDPLDQRWIDEHHVLEPRAAGEEIQSAASALDRRQPRRHGFVADGMCATWNPPLGGLVDGGIEGAPFPEEDPSMKHPGPGRSESSTAAWQRYRGETRPADRAAKRRGRGAHDLRHGKHSAHRSPPSRKGFAGPHRDHLGPEPVGSSSKCGANMLSDPTGIRCTVRGSRASRRL